MYTTFERYSTGLGSRFTRGFLPQLLKIIVITMFLYLLLSSMFLSAFQIESGSMLPALQPGDRILASPLTYGARFLFFSARLPAVREPARGDIVVIRSPMYRKPSFPISMLEPVLRFFSFQRASMVRDKSGRRVPPYMIKRIVGIPGDTVRMSGFRAFIKPEGSDSYREEQELGGSTYSILIEGLPEGWSKEFPFSGELQPLTLGEGQFFVLGDNRQGSSDSRSWGPLSREEILGNVMYRYWPLSRSGRL
jgi:signal peptidase I